MDTNEQIRMLEVSLTREMEEIKDLKKTLEQKQLAYENKMKQLSSMLNKGTSDGSN